MMSQQKRIVSVFYHLRHVLVAATVLGLAAFAVNIFLTTQQAQAQEVPAEAPTSLATALQPYLTFRVPTSVKALFTAAVLNVEGDSVFGNDISVKGVISTQDLIVNGKLTLNNDITGNDINIDVKEGKVFASNLVYSVAVGSGLSVSGTQDLTITNTDAGSGQSIFKKMKVGSDTLEADANDDTLEFAAGTGISLSLDSTNDKITISNSQTPGFVSSGGYAVLGSGLTRAGVGTSNPSNTLEVDSGTDGLSGLTFTRMTSSSTAGVGGGKVLSVDSGGKIILVSDQTGDAASAEEVLPSATNGMTLYFNGTEWVASDNMFHDGGSVGISNNAPTSRLHINTNLASKIGMIVQGYTSQTAHLQEWRDVNGNVLSYVDASGVFNGSANTSGSLNPGFTNGSLVFQGASGLTEDNSNLFWDNTNNRLGIGTTSPGTTLDVIGSSGIRASSTAGGNLGTLTFGTTDVSRYIRGNSAEFQVGETLKTLRFLSQTLTTFESDAASGVTALKLNARTAHTAGNLLEIANAGTSKVAVDYAGNLGIGTTSPGAALHVSAAFGGGAGAILNQINSGDIFTASASGTTRMVLTYGGNLGIGAATPNHKLSVHTGTSNSTLTTGAVIYNNGTGTGTGASLGLGYSPSTTGHAGISGYYDGTGPALGLFTGTSNTQRLTILNDGKVGIGTTAPSSLLEISGPAGTKFNVDSNDSAGSISIGDVNAIATRFYPTLTNWAVGGAAVPGMVLTYVDTDTGTEPAYIINSRRNGAQLTSRPLLGVQNYNSAYLFVVGATGNVGIGRPVPTAKLDMLGDLSVFGSATVSASYAGGKGLLVKGAESQTGNLLEWQTSTGTSLGAINSTGQWIPNATAQTDTSTGKIRVNTVGPHNHGFTLNLQDMAWTSHANSIPAIKMLSANIAPTATGTFIGVDIAPGMSGASSDWTVLRINPGADSGGTTRLLQDWAVAGTSKAVMTSGGLFGLGTTSPQGVLHVSGGYAGNAAAIINQTLGGDILTASASGTTRLTLTNAGNVSIGATAPTSGYKLDVQGATRIAGTTVVQGGSGASYIGVNHGAEYRLQTQSSVFTINLGDPTNPGFIWNGVTGNIGIGTGTPLAAFHVAKGSGGGAAVILNQSLGGDILTASASGTTRMTLTNAGNLGLGTNLPAAKLDISASPRWDDSTADPALVVRSSQTSETAKQLRMGFDSTSSNDFAFIQSAETSVGTKGLVLQGQGGNISVGTTTLTNAKIEVKSNGTNTGLLWLTATDGSRLGRFTETAGGQGWFEVDDSSGNAAFLVRGDAGTSYLSSGNFVLGGTAVGTSASKVFGIVGSTAPSTAITDGIQLWAEDVAGSHELRVMDEAANVTTLSPHNFSMIPDGRSEDLAWSFYSQRGALAINADMTKALRLVEKISGEKLVFIKDLQQSTWLEDDATAIAPAQLAQKGEISRVARWSYELWSFVGSVVFEGPAKFLANVEFRGKTLFVGRVTTEDKDAAGFLIIAPGQSEVEVRFEKPFEEKPVIQATAEEYSGKYQLHNVSKEGFTLRIEPAAVSEITFHWTALAVKSPRTIRSDASPSPVVVSSPQPTPSPVVTPEPSPTPIVTPSPEPTPSSVATSSAQL